LSLKRLNWSKLLRELREEAGMTQKDLAYKARMPQRTVAEYENVGADRQLSIYKIETILDVLGYEVEVFLKET
jgi:transcriptional regulator with XRE-family HTH domain